MKRVKELIQDIKENWWIGGLGDWGIGEPCRTCRACRRLGDWGIGGLGDWGIQPCRTCRACRGFENWGIGGTGGTSGTGGTQKGPTELTGSTAADRIADSLGRIADALEELVRAAKEKENIPPTPPKREKETLCAKHTKRARVRESFKKPTVEEVAAHIAEKGYTFDAEEFWNFYESKGWRVGSHVMRSWTSACVTWQKIENRRAKREAHLDAKMDERAEKRAAHIDAKMDEREAKREKRIGGRRKADNNVEMSDEVREEVRRDFTF